MVLTIALAALVSVSHTHTQTANGTIHYAAWEPPPDGMRILILLAALHLGGLNLARVLSVSGNTAQCTLALVAYTVVFYFATGANRALDHKPTWWSQMSFCCTASSFAVWSLSCSVVATYAPATKEPFWVGVAVGTLYMESLGWTSENVAWAEVNGGVGMALAAAGVVCAALLVARLSPVPAKDGAFLVVVGGVLGARLAWGYHVHHIEWPLYGVVLLRHSTRGTAAGILMGFMMQEAPDYRTCFACGMSTLPVVDAAIAVVCSGLCAASLWKTGWFLKMLPCQTATARFIHLKDVAHALIPTEDVQLQETP